MEVSNASSTYPSEDEKLIIDAVETLMEETMKKYDPSHDALHVSRVRRTALGLAKTLTPTPDLLVIELAALMHDLLDKKYVPPEDYADPYAYFLPFFQRLKTERGITVAADLVQDGRLKLITKIVENVSWTTEKKLRAEGRIEEWHETCKELHCVQDADRLDGIGAFGIMRCSAFSAVMNRPLYVPPGQTTRGGKTFEDSAIHHFHDKLLLVKEHLKTEAGKRTGERRHESMLSFLKDIDDEFNFVDGEPQVVA